MALENIAPLRWVYDLYLLSQTASVQGDPAQIQRKILEHFVSAFGAANGCLALTEESSGQLTIAAGIDLPAWVVGSKITLGDGILGWVAKEGDPLPLAGGVSSDPRFRNVAPRDKDRLPGSAMCWPLRIENRVIGALSVSRQAGGQAFTESDLDHGRVLVNLVTLVIENTRLHMEQCKRIETLSKMNEEILAMNTRLEDAHNQLLQSEKMASIGQLAAGMAHEINNPIGYVYSNLGTLATYLKNLFAVLDAYEANEAGFPPVALDDIRQLKQNVDIAYLREDIFSLMGESREGIARVKKIVQDLKDFSHADAEDAWQWTDLIKGLDSTLNIVHNEIKYKAEVVKRYSDLPEVECLSSQMNQVFMNILVNAAHAIEDRGVITLTTGSDGDAVCVEIADTGKGIAPEHLKRIFDPFFTTKPVGKGTGLGLSLSYGIVQKHHGKIEVQSEPGVGTKFRVTIPVHQTAESAEAA